jgi:hypothetical protein
MNLKKFNRYINFNKAEELPEGFVEEEYLVLNNDVK